MYPVYPMYVVVIILGLKLLISANMEYFAYILFLASLVHHLFPVC